MQARRIIEGASFGPEVLQVLRKAFDEAWSAVADKFNPDEHEAARKLLAHAMMSMTRDDTSDVAMLKHAGIRAIRSAYPSRFDPDSGQNGTDG